MKTSLTLLKKVIWQATLFLFFVLFYTEPGFSLGLTEYNNQIWYQYMPELEGTSEPGNHFGYSMTTGDFNNDHITDLAIGIPWKNVDGSLNAGAVHILYGDPDKGLQGEGDELIDQNHPALISQGGAVPYSRFGSVLAAGDFDGDGNDDLLVAAPGTNDNIGVVYTIFNQDGSDDIVIGTPNRTVNNVPG